MWERFVGAQQPERQEPTNGASVVDRGVKGLVVTIMMLVTDRSIVGSKFWVRFGFVSPKMVYFSEFGFMFVGVVFLEFFRTMKRW